MYKSTNKWAKELGLKDYDRDKLRKLNYIRFAATEFAGYGARTVTRNVIRNTPVQMDKLPPITRMAYGAAAMLMPSAVGYCVEGFVDGLFGSGVLLVDAVKKVAEEGEYESEDGHVSFKVVKAEDNSEDE